MAEWVKELAAKSDTPYLIPETHIMGWGEKTDSGKLSSDLICCVFPLANVGLYSRNIKTIEIL